MGSVSLDDGTFIYQGYVFHNARLSCFRVPDLFISPGMVKNPWWERFSFVFLRLGGSLKFLKDGKIGIILGNLDF